MQFNPIKTMRVGAAFGVAAALSAATFSLAAPPKKNAPKAKAKPVVSAVPASTQTGFTDNTPLTEEQRIVHVLNRVGFGARPGDVERIKAMGLSKYLEGQLNPTTQMIASAENKLSDYPALNQSSKELVASYYSTLRQGVEIKKMQGDIMERAKAGGAATDGMEMSPDSTPEDRQKAVRALMQNATPEEKQKLMAAMGKRKDKQARTDGIQDASRALQIAKVVRATDSEAQLYEVMADFWSNHFNIDVRKNACRVLKVADEREVSRKHALGTFRELLGASAHSPAMMVYLDNANNVAPEPDNPRREKMRQAYLDRMAKDGDPLVQAAVAGKRGKAGINENYAREIMELHTLGVDGGYTQKDVQEVARCFTGWGVGNRRVGKEGEWVFSPRQHDNGVKTVLGVTIPANGGEKDGEMVLDILASHPRTMRHVSTKLCQRLVSDTPPESLVNKCVATWKRTDGNIREITRTIVTSPEFYSRAAYRQKIKSPFEYAVSSVRAVGGTIDLSPQSKSRGIKNAKFALGKGGAIPGGLLTRTLAGQVTTMGQPLYQHQAPTGYSEDSRKWVSSGALVSRLNFALGLMNNEMVEVDLPGAPLTAATEPAQIVQSVTGEILRGDVSPATRATLLKQATTAVSENTTAAGQPLEKRLTALVLGSPEFQRR
ncbi:MAG: DUF1800 domain-containing protein [Armatimonadetes bacterium]|nr:DUF1800 domain-containing protein [Armatimonadota bacterium]